MMEVAEQEMVGDFAVPLPSHPLGMISPSEATRAMTMEVAVEEMVTDLILKSPPPPPADDLTFRGHQGHDDGGCCGGGGDCPHLKVTPPPSADDLTFRGRQGHGRWRLLWRRWLVTSLFLCPPTP